LNEPKSRQMFLSGLAGMSPHARKVGIVDDAVGSAGRLSSLSALFPHVSFVSVGPTWPAQLDPTINILIIPVSAASSVEIEDAARRLSERPANLMVVVALLDADVVTMRRLAREGADDIIPAPVSEPALALCLERLLTRGSSEPEGGRKPGQVIGVLKAGGGVGATSLSVQLAVMLARRAGSVCLADLDLQFGAAANYLDMPDAVTLVELLAMGESLEQTQFIDALPQHGSGLRVLAAPHDLTPLEVLSVGQVDALINGLRRDFSYTLVDLPSVWTHWTSRVLEMADRVMLVTHLTVPNVQLLKRQLRMLDDRPSLIVCNAPSKEQQSSLAIKAAERALERPFDMIIPDDPQTMVAAVNQGQEISGVRRGTKIEKAVGELADKILGKVAAETTGLLGRVAAEAAGRIKR
jgi:pilus assembly protein CpaE